MEFLFRVEMPSVIQNLVDDTLLQKFLLNRIVHEDDDIVLLGEGIGKGTLPFWFEEKAGFWICHGENGRIENIPHANGKIERRVAVTEEKVNVQFLATAFDVIHKEKLDRPAVVVDFLIKRNGNGGVLSCTAGVDGKPKA